MGVPTSSVRSTKSSTSSIEVSSGGAIELVGEPGIGKTRFSESSPGSRKRAGTSSSRARRRARARPAVLGLRGCSGRVHRGSRANRSRRPGRRRPNRARARLPHCPPSRAGARRHCSTSGIAATGPCRRCSSSSLRRSRSCWSSMTSTGPIRRRWSYWARCCAGRRAQRCSSPWPFDPTGRPNVCQLRSSRAHRAGTLTRLELGALTSDESELLGGAVDAAAAALLYEESVATRSTSSSSPVRSTGPTPTPPVFRRCPRRSAFRRPWPRR